MSEREWTLPAFKEYVDARFEAAEKAVEAALAAAEKAVLKAEARTLADKEASNEIRGAMVDAQRNFADKGETDRRLKMLEDAHIMATSKTIGVGQLWGMVVAVIVVVSAIMGIIFKFGAGG